MNLEPSHTFANLADILDLSKPLDSSSYNNSCQQNRITLDFADPSATKSTHSISQSLSTMYQGYEGQNKISFNITDDYVEPS